MKILDIETLDDKTVALIKKLEELTKKKIKIEYENVEIDDYIYLSQSKHIEKNDEILITIEKTPNINYMISHELFHILLNCQEYSDISIDLFTDNAGFNSQEQATAQSLKGILDHRIIEKWEIAENVRTEEIQSSLNQGTKILLAAKDIQAPEDQLVLYRMLLILDNYSKDILQIDDYQKPKQIAQNINQELIDISNKSQYFHALTNLFAKFDREIQSLGYIDLKHQELVTITPVFSNRQLRLVTNQVIEILHSDYLTKGKKDAYVIRLKSGEQNIGVFELNKKQKDPKYFQELYQMNLGEFLKQFNINYLIR